MVTLRTCKARKQDGSPCGSPPLQEGDFCYMHDPEHADEAAKARSLGGQRRRRESTLAGAYEIGPLDTVGGIRRVLEIVIFDALGMEANSVARGRLLIAGTQVLTKLLEVSELEQRLADIEAIVKPRGDLTRRRR